MEDEVICMTSFRSYFTDISVKKSDQSPIRINDDNYANEASVQLSSSVSRESSHALIW